MSGMQARRWYREMLAVALIVIGLIGWRAAHAQDATQPMMLVAVPQLGGFYQHTVVMVIPVAGDRHVGFILNRPTERSMASLFPQHEPSKNVVSPVFLGGPEMVNSIFAVLPVKSSPEGGKLPFAPGTCIVADQKSIDEIIEKSPNDARYFAGFVAWQAGDLEDELNKGMWQVMPPQVDLIFAKEVDHLWDELSAGGNRVMTQAPLAGERLAALQ